MTTSKSEFRRLAIQAPEKLHARIVELEQQNEQLRQDIDRYITLTGVRFVHPPEPTEPPTANPQSD